jgi:hypothetical protein
MLFRDFVIFTDDDKDEVVIHRELYMLFRYFDIFIDYVNEVVIQRELYMLFRDFVMMIRIRMRLLFSVNYICSSEILLYLLVDVGK